MDVKNKAKIFRGLKLISYLMGLPLVVFYIWRDTQGMSKDGLKVALIIWAAITVCQVVCSFLFKKNTYRRPRIAAATLSLALILSICTPYCIDMVYGAKLADINEKYKDAPVTRYTYEDLLLDYKSIAGRSESISGSFSSVYNLNAGNKGKNIIYTTVDSNGATVDCDAKDGNGKFGYASYNPNGLLGDGYVFSSGVAIDLLRKYYAAHDALLAKYGSEEALQTAYIKALRDAKNSAEYADYLNDDDIQLYLAEAEKYNVISENSSAKLDAILGLIGKELGPELKSQLKSSINKLSSMLTIVDIDGILAGIYGFTDTDVVDKDGKYAGAFLTDPQHDQYSISLSNAVPKVIDIIFDDLFNKNLSLTNLENQLYKVIEDLYAEFYVKVQSGINHYNGDDVTVVPPTIEVSSVYELFNRANDILAALGLNVDIQEFLGVTINADTKLPEVLAALLTNKLGMTLQNAPETYTLNALVTELLGEFVGLYPYQHPMVKPAFMFIEDETMLDYAWCLYEGQVHGKFCGSVLVGGSTIGDGTSADQAFSAADIDRMLTIDAYESEMRPLFSWIALRVLLINYAALIIGTLILVNVFGYFEDRQMAKLVEGEYDEEDK